jgi:hypothetical protein
LGDLCFSNGSCDALGNCVGDFDPGLGCWKNRFLPMQAIDTGDVSALRVRMLELQNPQPPNGPEFPPPDLSAYEFGPTCTDPDGCERWVAPVDEYFEFFEILSLGGFRAARLQCTPYYTDWAAEGPFYIYGAEIIPSSLYQVDQLDATCMGNENACPDIVQSLSLATARHGDTAEPFNPPSTTGQPNALDIVAIVDHYKHLPNAPKRVWVSLYPALPELNGSVDILDVANVVNAFKGFAYAYGGPCPCDSPVTCNATPCTSAAQCSGGLCVRTCVGGSNSGEPCFRNGNCLDGTCGPGFCRDRCGGCSP